MRGGIIAGSVSAIVAALVSLPLPSPDDVLINSATVVIAALITGAGAGVIWRILSGRRHGVLQFASLWLVALLMTAIFAVAGETQLDRFLAFVLSLAAIVFAITGLMTVLLGRVHSASWWWPAPLAVVAALALGVLLAGQGDQESGSLELPPRAGDLTPSKGDGTRSLSSLSEPSSE